MNVLVRKLELFAPLSDEDKLLLEESIRNTRVIDAHVDLSVEGSTPSSVHLVLTGLAFRYKTLEDGRRQILGFLVPGDFCDAHSFVLTKTDHSLATACVSTIVGLSPERIMSLSNRPAILRAFWWATLVEEAIAREWLVNLGKRNAEASLSHLFCELHMRLSAVGSVTGGALRLPLTQSELGDVLGLSTVHVNRSLQSLRGQGLIVLRNGVLELPDVARLRAFCGFKDDYLHHQNKPFMVQQQTEL